MSASSPAVTLPPGYRDAVPVGRGAQGTVYRVTREDTESVVALKAVHIVDDRLPAAVQNELDVLKCVPGHESLVDIRAVSRLGDVAWLEMPYCPSTLHIQLQHAPRRPGPTFLEQVLQWAAQVSGAVAHLHSKGLVHRDIKPGNVLIDVAGNARLGDFGLARPASELAATGPARVGTPKYLAPEVSRGPATPASDVYALGVALSDIRGLFRSGDGRSSDAAEQTTVTDLDPGDVLATLDALISRMTSPDPQRRPTAAEASGELRHLHLASVGITARRTPPRRWVSLGVAAALLAVAALTLLPRLTTHAAGPATWARFDNPDNNENVSSPFVAHGQARLPSGKVLWVMVQPPDGAYYPAVRTPVPVDASGAWSVTVNLGQGTLKDVGLSYDLYAVLAPAAQSAIQAAVQQAALTGHSARFDPLPAEATTLSHRHVKLSGYPQKGI